MPHTNPYRPPEVAEAQALLANRVFAARGAAAAAGAASGILPNSFSVGDLLYANSVSTLARLADVAAGSYLRSGGVLAAPAWSATIYPNSAVAGDLLYAASANTYANLADAAVGNALLSGGVGVAPAWGKVSLTAAISGSLPVTNLNSGTGATSATFWRGDGTWSNALTAGLSVTSLASVGGITLTDVGGNGANIKLVGDGAVTPNKHIRSNAGVFDIVNSAYTQAIFSVTDAGVVSASSGFSGTLTGHSTLDLPLAGGTLSGALVGTTGAFSSTGAQFALSVSDTGNGGGVKFIDPTSGTPNKTIRSSAGNLQVVNSAYTTVILGLTNAGALSVNSTMITNSSTFVIGTNTSWANGAGASAGTLTNAPAVGNPTKWIPFYDNGTTRYVPAW